MVEVFDQETLDVFEQLGWERRLINPPTTDDAAEVLALAPTPPIPFEQGSETITHDEAVALMESEFTEPIAFPVGNLFSLPEDPLPFEDDDIPAMFMARPDAPGWVFAFESNWD